jgi:hypothetical protein
MEIWADARVPALSNAKERAEKAIDLKRGMILLGFGPTGGSLKRQVASSDFQRMMARYS